LIEEEPLFYTKTGKEDINENLSLVLSARMSGTIVRS
jgi:hypothetical protein